jgi:hypothetical protein
MLLDAMRPPQQRTESMKRVGAVHTRAGSSYTYERTAPEPDAGVSLKKGQGLRQKPDEAAGIECRIQPRDGHEHCEQDAATLRVDGGVAAVIAAFPGSQQ